MTWRSLQVSASRPQVLTRCCGRSRPELAFLSKLSPISHQGDPARRVWSPLSLGQSSHHQIFPRPTSASPLPRWPVQVVSTLWKLNFPMARCMILQTCRTKRFWLLMLRPSGRWYEFRSVRLMYSFPPTRSGFTSQYRGLQALYDKYKDKGLVILGFPCNQVCCPCSC